MSKYTKAILIGVLSFVGAAAALIVSRSLIRSIPIAETASDVVNWVLAVFCGGSAGFSVWKKEDTKK